MKGQGYYKDNNSLQIIRQFFILYANREEQRKKEKERLQ